MVPALSHARASAQRTDCLSRLRQLGVAIQLYTSDSQGCLPCPSDAFGADACWFYAVDPYLTMKPGSSSPTAAQKLAQVKQDPVWNRFDAASKSKWRTIKMNRKLVGKTGDDPNWAVNSWRRISQVCNPATTPLLFDGTVEKTKSGGCKMWYHGWEVYVELRHKGGANILFVDGHVQCWEKGKRRSNGVGWESDSTTLTWWAE